MQIKTKEVNIVGEEYREWAVELMKDGYDLHTHSTPSHANRALDDFMLLREADRYGMAGVMIKNHYEPTAARAAIANLYAGAKKTKAFGAVVLNWPVGGLNPYAVESSLKMGAKIVWMPTKDTAHCLRHGDMKGDFFSRPGIAIYDEDGKMKNSVFEIIDIVKKYDAYLATGHLSVQESVDLCKAARKRNAKMILTHPDWYRTVVPLEIQIELAETDVLIEKLWQNIAEGYISAENMAQSMQAIGFERIFMATDRGVAGREHPAEGMLLYIEAVLRQGIKEKEIKNMICHVPKRIVG